MKLIDADEVKNSLLTELLTGVDGGTDTSYLKTYEVIDRIENIVNEWLGKQPTVDAIPIKWIVGWLTKQTIPATHTCDYYDAVEMMLDDWEKENERNV